MTKEKDYLHQSSKQYLRVLGNELMLPWYMELVIL